MLVLLSAVTADADADTNNLYISKGHNLLGSGFDPLLSEPRMPIIQLSYNKSNTNLDHNGLIPDYTIQINTPRAREEFYAQELTWSKSTEDTQRFHMDAKASVWKISGSFSYDNNWIHKSMSNKFHRVARITMAVRTATYVLELDRINIDSHLVEMLQEIANAVRQNTTISMGRAAWYADELIRMHGPMIIYKVDVGGHLQMLTTIDTNRWQDYNQHDLKVAAGVHFKAIFNLDINVQNQHTSTASTAYNASLVDTTVETIGGEPWKDGQSANDWQSTLIENPAPVRTYSMPLLDIITPKRAPQMSPVDIQYARRVISERIENYILQNTYYGCRDPSAADFNPSANIHDPSACLWDRKFSFGGMFQTSPCADYQIKNELTQDLSCPKGFTAYPVLEPYRITHNTVDTTSYRSCHSCWLVATCCKWKTRTDSHHSQCVVAPHVCMASINRSVTHGDAFGGMFTDTMPNPITEAKNCPDGFNMIKFATDWGNKHYFAACYAPFDTMASQNGVPFGGIFSTEHTNPDTHDYNCPPGFGRHSLPIHGGKNVYFCATIRNNVSTPQYLYPGYGAPEPSFVEGYRIGDDYYLMTNISSNISYAEQYMEVVNYARMQGIIRNVQKGAPPISITAKDTNTASISEVHSNALVIAIPIIAGIVLCALIIGGILMYRHRHTPAEYSQL